jgi:hypothetical protein
VASAAVEALGASAPAGCLSVSPGQLVSGRPFLKRTPQALHSVRGPSGPHRHCGVWCVLQLRQVMRRGRRPGQRNPLLVRQRN